jgi:hypothetical protein
MPFPISNFITKAIPGLFRTGNKVVRCPTCEFEANYSTFHKVAVYEDEYSVIF